MGNKFTCNLKRLPKCMHIDGPQCRCAENNGELPAQKPAPARNPEFTMQQLIEQTLVPIVTIDIGKPLARCKLNGLHRKLIKKAKKEASQFVQGSKPILPQKNSLASIALRSLVDPAGHDWETVRVCFELKSFYIKGVLVRGRFYELRKSKDVKQLVQGSIPLECSDTYLELFGREENPEVQLRYQALVDAFWQFLALGPRVNQQVLREAARCIGMISLILIEPSRQTDVAEKLCDGDQTDTTYFTMDNGCWEIIRLWDDRSKIAKGIEYKDKTVEERIRHPDEVTEAVKRLSVVNSTKFLPAKKTSTRQHTRAL